MAKLLKKAVLGATLAATALTAAAPAEAQRYRRYHRGGGGDVAAGAVLGGIVGLGLGAAIASSNRNRYYDRGYYDRGYYPRNNYYNDYRPRYRQQYRPYYQPYYGGYANRCYTVREFDPYTGRRIRTRICD